VTPCAVEVLRRCRTTDIELAVLVFRVGDRGDARAGFTSAAFLDELEGCGVRVSMDGKGRFLDNIFIERLGRSLKYEEVFIKAYGSVAEARRGIGVWFAFYNNERPHQALDYRTPSQVFERAKACGHVDNARGVDHMPTVAQQQTVSIP
jgi:putative transposase